MNYIYEIKILNIRRYIGITNDPNRRLSQHKRSIKKQDKKTLYQEIIKLNLTEKDIEMNILFQYENRTEAIRKEAQLTLNDWFDNKELWQHPLYYAKYY